MAWLRFPIFMVGVFLFLLGNLLMYQDSEFAEGRGIESRRYRLFIVGTILRFIGLLALIPALI